MLLSLVLYPVCPHLSLAGDPKTLLSSALLTQVWPHSVKETVKPEGQSHMQEGEKGTGHLNGTEQSVGEEHHWLLSSQWDVSY